MGVDQCVESKAIAPTRRKIFNLDTLVPVVINEENLTKDQIFATYFLLFSYFIQLK